MNKEQEFLRSLGLIPTGFEGKWRNNANTVSVIITNGVILMTNLIDNEPKL